MDDKETISAFGEIHNPSSCKVKSNKGDDMIKYQLIYDYYHTMGGVGRAHQELSYYETTRKQKEKFYKKVFRHLIDQSLFNAFIIY